MPQAFTLRPREAREWMGILERSCGFDFYHTPGYHALAEARGEGEGWLLGVEDAGELVAVPLLLRRIAGAEGAADGSATAAGDPGWRDATSVYGYPGPVATRPDPPAALLAAFRAALTAELGRRGVVAVFSRLHPLLDQPALLTGLGDVVPGGETVSIDLTLPAAERRRRYRTSHRYDIDRLLRRGLIGAPDLERRHLDAFVALYGQAMDRVGGGAEHRFARGDLERLLAVPEAAAVLMVCRAAGDRPRAAAAGPACAGIFLSCRGIAQYHLAATAPAFERWSPLKLLIDAAAEHAAAGGARVLHLGGGVGGADDGLLHFKRGFSDRRHRFATWRWVVDPAAYRELCRRRGVPAEAAADPAHGYFPAFRAPAARPTSEPAPAAVADAGVPA